MSALGLPSDPDDSEKDFLADTLWAGQFLGDQPLVQTMVTGIAALIETEMLQFLPCYLVAPEM